MLIELRRYTVVPGKLKAYLEVYDTHGRTAQQRHVGDPLGYFISDTGELNQVVHLWRFDDHADRKRKRAAMDTDPDWQTYKKMTEAGGYLQRQESEFLTSAPWSQL